jgi:hypothetical protein
VIDKVNVRQEKEEQLDEEDEKAKDREEEMRKM